MSAVYFRTNRTIDNLIILFYDVDGGDNMPDYQKMYFTLVDTLSNTVDYLKTALEKAEEIYIETSEDEEESGA